MTCLACSGIFLFILTRSPLNGQTATNNPGIVSKPLPSPPKPVPSPSPQPPRSKKYQHLRKEPWYLPVHDEADELSQQRRVPGLVPATKSLLEKHPQVIFAGDSTIRQLLFGWVGLLKALEEGSIVENDVGTEWTSERWMEEIMEGCPSSMSEWERKENQRFVGKRCAYGDTQIVQDFRGTSEDPEAMGVQFKYCDNKGGANLWDPVHDNGMEDKGRRLVVVNFRTLHLLHFYPARPFEDYVVLDGLMDSEKFLAFFEKELRALLR